MLPLLLTATALLVAAPQDAAPRPDIVLIMADDMGWSDIAPYGGEIRTPNLQRLADDGLRFTQFYNTGRCCPTRASLLTGLYPHQAGVGHMIEDKGWDAYRGDLGADTLTIAEALRSGGYATAMAGKWHVTRQIGHWTGDDHPNAKTNWPLQRGFEQFYGTIHGAGSFFDPSTLTAGNDPLPPPAADADFYYTDAIADAAAGFVRQHAQARADDPLFLYVAFTAPHWPLHARPEDIARYKGRYDQGWEVLRRERLARQKELSLLPPDQELSPHPTDWADAPYPEWQKRAMEVYAAMIDSMDQGIGRVIEALEESGRLDNAVIVFLADNGGCAEGGTAFERHVGPGSWLSQPKFTRDGRLVRHGNYDKVMPGPEDTYQEYGPPWANASNTPFRLYKHFVHEGGIASPLIVHWPAGVRDHGALRAEPAHLIDLMPTFLELAGTAAPRERAGVPVQALAGESLLPVWDGRRLPRRALFWEHEGNRAVRLGDLKAVARWRRDATVWELYDLARDRAELHDLAAERSDELAALVDLYETWAEHAGVQPWPVPAPESASNR